MEGTGGTARRISSRSSSNGQISSLNIAAYNNLLQILVVLMCWMIPGYRAWDCAASDRTTLLDFKSGFVDRDGVFSTWNVSSNCCTWSGVTCRESDGAVLALTLIGTSSGSSNQQSYRDASYTGGTVGAVLTSLSDLQKLTIQWVLFDGPIPSQWGQFSSNLEVIVVNNANLRDDIPSGLASIPNLQTLDLKSNHLTGAIPAAFCDDRSLEYIDVSYNDMNYLLVPTCFQQGQSNGNVTVVYNSQGQSSSPGAPASSGGGLSVLPSSEFIFAFGALSSALLLRTLL